MSNFYKETDDMLERYELVTERIPEIPSESQLTEKLQVFFGEVAAYIVKVRPFLTSKLDGSLDERSLEQCKKDNELLFAGLTPEAYATSFLNPEYAVAQLGETLGGILSAIYYRMTELVGFAFEGRLDLFTMYCELFMEVYGICCMEEEDKYRREDIESAMFSFMHDNAEVFIGENILAMIDPDCDFYTSIIKKAELSDDRYLYSYGMYVGPNELGIAAHLRSLSEEAVAAMAHTYVDGYVRGFEVCGKDISKKEVVELHVPVGFELMARAAMKEFNEQGLACTLRRGENGGRMLYTSVLNKQMVYDHKEDKAYYFDKGLADRNLEALKNMFEKNKEQAVLYGGPAVIETFGDVPFEPTNKAANAKLSDKQNEVNVYLMSQQGQIINEYIHGEERSFTIIAYPIPEIGKDFKAIFDETVAVNTMDYDLYKDIQQHIIDTLDEGVAVHVTGRGDNHTDITVALHELTDKSKQTNFENCVADVNIPVGEVFTSPVLEGTNGVLHVTQVYLNELGYKDLEMKFVDGKITEYTCKNFDSEEENKKYVFDNVLFKHDTLPIGEFAIGTNTTAFVMGQKYDIAGKLPILIAEKTGPHFAVGDTCYSHSEDVPMYNPDGKECIARDNSCSILRKEDFTKAYFNCHTDITIPYSELGDITVICADGRQLPVIEQGKFVVPGTEELNKALEAL